MKKLFLLLVVAAGAFAFSSCEKAYNCTQEYYYNGVLENTVVYSYSAMTKEEVTDEENLHSYYYIDTDGDKHEYKTVCE